MILNDTRMTGGNVSFISKYFQVVAIRFDLIITWYCIWPIYPVVLQSVHLSTRPFIGTPLIDID